MGAHAFDDDLPRTMHHMRAVTHAVHARRTHKIFTHGLGSRDREAERPRFPGRHHDGTFPRGLAVEFGGAVDHVLFPLDDLLMAALRHNSRLLPR